MNATVDSDVQVRIVGLPAGLSGETVFKSSVARVSNGPTMANAGIVHPAGRGD